MYRSVSAPSRAMIKHNPVISLDFLARYLALGPHRAKTTVASGAVFTYMSELADAVPDELIEAAQRIRTESSGLSERLIRRRISTGIDKLRTIYGPVQGSSSEDVATAAF